MGGAVVKWEPGIPCSLPRPSPWSRSPAATLSTHSMCAAYRLRQSWSRGATCSQLSGSGEPAHRRDVVAAVDVEGWRRAWRRSASGRRPSPSTRCPSTLRGSSRAPTEVACCRPFRVRARGLGSRSRSGSRLGFGFGLELRVRASGYNLYTAHQHPRGLGAAPRCHVE